MEGGEGRRGSTLVLSFDYAMQDLLFFFFLSFLDGRNF